MADNTIDTLSLEIHSNAGQAVKSIDNLIDSLNRLASGVGKGLGNLRTVAGDIRQLNNATKNLDTSKLSAYGQGLNNLSEGVERFANIGNKITPAVTALGKLSGLDLSKMKVSGDYSGLSSLAEGAGKLADVAPRLAALKATDLNRALKSFEKIGNVDFSGTVQSLQALNGLDVTGFTVLTQSMTGFADSVGKLAQLKIADITRAVKAFERLSSLNISSLAAGLQSLNGVDLTRLSELGTAFQSFASSLSGSERIAAGTQRIITALSNLAVSAANIPTVTANLPGLSAALLDLLNVISAAPAVEAGTVSLVAGLAALSGSGSRIERVVSSLPALTAGILDFLNAMESAPKVNKNTIRLVEALSRLSESGAKAGNAAKNLQANINRLAGSMGNLRNGTMGGVRWLKSFTGQLLASLGIVGGLYGAVRAAKASINTYSDLIEVDNVVQKSFGQTANKMEDLAKISISDFGMSELTAKQIASRYQAMGVAMGFTQDKMSDMSLELTKLAADMASFYNVEQKDVAESLESIFTGTTRPLRTYGLDLTQATLQEWALKQGIDADIQSMSQMEKTMLRYQYVLANTENIAGDFRDTQGSWANQTRILIEQFKQLGSVIGGGLVAALLPAVKALNVFLAKIIQVARAISSFLGGLLGIKGTVVGAGAGLAQTSDYADDLADSTEAAAGGIADTGSAAKKAKKDLRNFSASWHEINNMTSNDDSGTGGSGGSVAMPDMSLPREYNLDVTATDNTSPILDAIRKRFIELKDLFIRGFYFGVGDLSVFDCIRQHLANIRENFLDIFTDDAVVSSFNNLLNTLAFNAGAKLGAFTSVGLTIADNILGGIDLYLGEAKERIKNWLVHVFDLTGEIDTIRTNLMVSVAEIFTVFRGDEAKALTADIIRIFADAFMNISELALKLGRDLLGLILSPITENASGFKTALENTISPLETIMSSISNSFTSLWETVQATYDNHVAPMFEAFKEGLSQIIRSLLEGYNTHIAPVLSNLASKFMEVWEGTISPLLENFIGLFGDVADFVTAVWTNVFQPVVNWIATAIMPVVAPVLQSLGDAFLVTFEAIGKLFDAFVTAARGVLQFLTGVFSGDWQKAWTGVGTIFKSVWSIFPSFVKEPIRAIIGSVNKMIDAIQNGINYVIRGLNKFHFDTPDWLPGGLGGKSFGFNLSEISLPRIPQLAKGGITTGATLALIGEAGREAILPLENTGWIDSLSERISENLSKDFGNLQLDYSVPAIEEYSRQYSDSDMGRLKSTLQMEMDEKLAQAAYENRQLQEAVERNTQILEQILSQGIVLDDNTFTNKYKSASTKFYKQHRYEMGLYPAGR